MSYSITTTLHGKRSEPETALMSPEKVAKRAADANPCYTAAFALTAGIAASHFWYNAAGTCPATASDDNINNAQCALASIFGVIFTFLTGFASYGTYRNPARRSVPAIGDPQTHLIDDYAMTFTRLEDKLAHPFPEDDGWTHYEVVGMHVAGRHNYTNVISFHRDGGGRVTHPLEDYDSDLQKRASQYTAYYGWTQGDVSTFTTLPVCQTRRAAAKAAEQLYNYGKYEDSGDFCADLTAGNYMLTHGNFAVLSGTFSKSVAVAVLACVDVCVC